MKKIFTLIVAGVVMLASTTASARNTAAVTHVKAKNFTLPTIHSSTTSRALGCDTLSNLDFSTDDSTLYLVPLAPLQLGGGYLDGTGGLDFGSGPQAITGLGEEYTAPAGFTNQYATFALAFFDIVTVNPTDSNLLVTAYIYDNTGTAAYGGIAPGNALDSATTTLGLIARRGAGVFSFTHQAVLPSRDFFFTLSLPQIAGDTLVVPINDATVTGNGKGYVNIPTNGGWASYDSISQGMLVGGHLFYVGVCGTAAVTCPTINVATAVTGSSATATPTGGTAPYTYAWSTTPNQQTTATATGLTAGATYTVTATDANGCTGLGTVSLPNGINDIVGMTNFSVYPNPSNGAFTTNISLEAASDITISVIGMTGNKVFESTDKSVKELSKSINLSSIAAGIYVVNVRTAQGSINQRITVK